MSNPWTFVLLTGLCQGVSFASQCTTSGRFPNDAVEGCRAYTMCIDGGNGNFIDYNLTCPPSFVFSPLENVCTNVTNYQCLSMVLPFNCSGLGNFENPHANDCKTYVACILGLNDAVLPRLIECPMATLYDPVKGACVNETGYKCKVEAPVTVAPESHVWVDQTSEIPVMVGVTHHNKAFNGRAVLSTLIFVMFSLIIL